MSRDDLTPRQRAWRDIAFWSGLIATAFTLVGLVALTREGRAADHNQPAPFPSPGFGAVNLWVSLLLTAIVAAGGFIWLVRNMDKNVETRLEDVYDYRTNVAISFETVAE